MASLTLAFMLGTTACGPLVEPEETDGSSSAEESGPTPMTSTTTVGTSSTTAVPMTEEGPATTTIEGSTGSSDDLDDGPCAFYAGCPPDINTNPIECDIFAQDCPSDEKCMPWANDGGTVWNATRCTPVADDPGAPGDPCIMEGSEVSGLDNCDVGVMCFHVDARTNEGTCVAMCTGTPEEPQCAAPEEACLLGSDGLIALCYDVCHPLDPMCEAGSGCFPTSSGEQFLCTPASGEDLPHGEPCSFIASCAGGTCLDSSLFPDCAGVSCCAEYCDVDAGLPCPDADQGVACVPWYEEGTAPAGYENVGVCVIPP